MALEGVRGASPPVPAPTAAKTARRFHLRRIAVWLIVASLLFFGIRQLRYELRSYALLAHFVYPKATGPLLRLGTDSISGQDVCFPTSAGLVPGRLYLPLGV